jgi:hypothetical protein
MKNNKQEEFEVFQEESELVWRTKIQTDTLDLQDLELLKTVYKCMQKVAVIPIVLPIAIAISIFPKPVIADPKLRIPTSIIKIDLYKNEKSSSPSFQKGETYIDSLTGETFEILFYSKDSRAPKNGVKIQVIKKTPWSDGGLLYNGLIYLQQSTCTFEQNKRLIDLVFQENIKQGTTNFQVKRDPLKGRLLGGQQPQPQQEPEVTNRKVKKSKHLKESLLLLGGILIIGTSSVALAGLYIRQGNEVRLLKEVLGLNLRMESHKKILSSIYLRGLGGVNHDCQRPSIKPMYQLCEALDTMQALDQVIRDELMKLQMSNPGLTEIYISFQKGLHIYVTQLFQKYGWPTFAANFVSDYMPTRYRNFDPK